jgi:Tol biopolymer transport system component
MTRSTIAYYGARILVYVGLLALMENCALGSVGSTSAGGQRLEVHPKTSNHVQVFGIDGAPSFSSDVGTDGVIDCVAWSPDGKTWAVNGQGVLSLTAAEGSSASRVLWSTPDIISFPSWSLDSRTIYFGVSSEAGGELMSISASGGHPTSIGFGTGISPSPGGGGFMISGSQGILTETSLDGPTAQIAQIGLSPSWAPDGKHIAYELDSNDVTRPQIVIMTAVGTKRKVVTWGEDPAYSPDGRFLAFLRPTSYFGTLFVRNLETGVTRAVSAPGIPVSECQPSWSPDSSQVAVVVVDNRDAVTP